MKVLGESDRAISVLSEAAARKLNRRESLFRIARGSAGGLAALSVGGLARATSAFAACGGSCGPSSSCLSYGISCPSGGGCAAGHDVCNSSRCGANCPWSNGQWVACTGCHDSGSYKVCTDCFIQDGTCSPHCNCLSGCLCSGCDTAAQMQADMASRGILVGA